VNLEYCKTHEEAGEADHSAAHQWLLEEWPKLVTEYPLSDIYNADETGLYYRVLPEHTFVFKNDNASGVKACKKRITLLCCGSMAGEKRKLLAIGKSKSPRCFKGGKTLPVQYVANRNAWMTAAIFCDWLLS